MTQRQPGLFGNYITDDTLHRTMPWHGAIIEGMSPSISGVGGGAGWVVALSPSDRGLSVWRTKGDAEHGCQTIEEDEAVIISIDPPDANPRIDLILGIHLHFDGPIDGLTGLPTGDFLTEQHADYVVLKGTPATAPEAPVVEDPFDLVGRHAVVLAAVRVASESDNVAMVEAWDPTDWTHARRALPHVLSFEASNPDPGVDHDPYTFGIVSASSAIPDFDFDDLAILIPRSGYYHVNFTAEAAAKIARLMKKSVGETVYSDIHVTTGRISAIFEFTLGDRLVLGGDSAAGTMAGTLVYLGFSDQDGELQDPANSFDITNADITEYGATTFPHLMTIPITTTGATPPIAWRILAGTDLPGASLDGDNVLANLSNYGSWTLKIYGKDSIGKTGRKTIRILKLPSAISVDTPEFLLLQGSPSGQAWDDVDGDAYGYLGSTGFTRTFTITKSGGVGPYSFFGTDGTSLLNPNVNSGTGVANLWIPAVAQQASETEYNGQTTMTLTVRGAFGARTDKTVKSFAPRMHAKAGAASLYIRDTPTHITLARPVTATFTINMATGSPAASQFQTGTHVWSYIPEDTDVTGAGVSADTDTTATFTADVPASLGTYHFKVKAVVTVGSQTTNTEQAIELQLVPHGWLGLGWTDNTADITADPAEHWQWVNRGYSGNTIGPDGAVFHNSKFWAPMIDIHYGITGGPDAWRLKVFSSTDGAAWTEETISGITFPGVPDGDQLYASLTKSGPSGSPVFVMAIYSESLGTYKFHTSTDMLAWTAGNDIDTGPLLRGNISYNAGAPAGKYGNLGTHGANGQGLWVSSNGRTWNTDPESDIPGSSPSDPNPYNRLGSDGVGWLAVANNKVAYTTDTTSWAVYTIPNGNWTMPCWTGSLWIMVENGGNRAITSPDGVVWTVRALPSTKTWTRWVWTGEAFVAFGMTAQKLYYLMTVDGITWKQQQMSLSGDYGAPYLVASDGFNFMLFTSKNVLDYGYPWGFRSINLLSY